MDGRSEDTGYRKTERHRPLPRGDSREVTYGQNKWIEKGNQVDAAQRELSLDPDGRGSSFRSEYTYGLQPAHEMSRGGGRAIQATQMRNAPAREISPHGVGDGKVEADSKPPGAGGFDLSLKMMSSPIDEVRKCSPAPAGEPYNGLLLRVTVRRARNIPTHGKDRPAYITISFDGNKAKTSLHRSAGNFDFNEPLLFPYRDDEKPSSRRTWNLQFKMRGEWSSTVIGLSGSRPIDTLLEGLTPGGPEERLQCRLIDAQGRLLVDADGRRATVDISAQLIKRGASPLREMAGASPTSPREESVVSPRGGRLRSPREHSTWDNILEQLAQRGAADDTQGVPGGTRAAPSTPRGATQRAETLEGRREAALSPRRQPWE